MQAFNCGALGFRHVFTAADGQNNAVSLRALLTADGNSVHWLLSDQLACAHAVYQIGVRAFVKPP
jgi:hypothetical protein